MPAHTARPSGRGLAAIALLGAFLSCPPLPAHVTPTRYDVVEIPTVPGYPFSRTSRINELGHAVGGNWACPYILSCLGRAFLFNGVETLDFTAPLLESLPANAIGITRGVDLNDAGDVLVWLTIVDVGLFPYLWRDGEEFIEIEGPPLALGTTAWALNASGRVVGTYTKDADTRAFVWDADAGVVEIIHPVAGFTSSGGRGINDAGDIVGSFSGGPGPGRGFLWSSGQVTVLEPFFGDVQSQAIDVTNGGLVAGVSTDAGGSDRLALWQDGVIVHAVALPYDAVWIDVQQVSEDGVVVGNFWPIFDFPQHFAFRWSAAEGFQQLDELDLSTPDLNLWEASGVNVSGQIVAWGEYPGFVAGMFLLTPAAPIAGDLDGDGAVTVSDLLLLLGAWGDCPDPSDCAADLDGDGLVGVTDLLILLANWG